MTTLFQKARAYSHNRKKGFALLLAVLISGIVLAIGLSILNITLKQYIFSNLGRESEIAFYAADAGMECALYWDASSKGGEFNIGKSTTKINCMGIDSDEPTPSGVIAKEVTITTSFEWGTPPTTPKVCAKIYVTKYEEGDSMGVVDGICKGSTCTRIESKGYNSGCTVTSPRTVERALKAVY